MKQHPRGDRHLVTAAAGWSQGARARCPAQMSWIILPFDPHLPPGAKLLRVQNASKFGSERLRLLVHLFGVDGNLLGYDLELGMRGIGISFDARAQVFMSSASAGWV